MNEEEFTHEGFGDADTSEEGQGGRKAKTRTLKQGHNEARILPAMHSMVATRTWHKYITLHWGYSLPNQKTPSESYNFPFVCPQEKNFLTSIITHACPECDRFEAKAAEYNQVLSSYKATGLTEKQAKEALVKNEAHAQLAAWVQKHRPDRKEWMNVQGVSGEFYPLKINYKLFKVLKERVKEVQSKYGINPFALSTGVWWDFIRTSADMTQNTDTVSPLMLPYKDSSGQTAERIKVTPMSKEQCDAALAACPDLNDVARHLTDQQIAELAACDEEPEVVREIVFRGQPVPAQRSTARASSPPASRPATTVTSTAQTGEVTSAQVMAMGTALGQVATTPDDDEAEAMRALEDIRRRKAAAKQAAASATVSPVDQTVVVQPKTTGAVSALADVGDDDFFAGFGKK